VEINQMRNLNMRRVAPLFLTGLTLMLAGCQYDVEDAYEPVSVQERYPIRVVDGTAKTGIKAPHGVLTTDQVNAVSNFATEARRTASSRVSIKYPSGSASSRAVASNIATLMMEQGIPRSRIAMAGYHASASAPIELVLHRKIAVTDECGDWSRDLSDTYYNDSYNNFGCATQQNTAAMVADPEDFERPRPMGPVLAGNRTETMKVYVENATAGDYWSLDVDGQSAKSP
jgi:pilus assembly protein CpaD